MSEGTIDLPGTRVAGTAAPDPQPAPEAGSSSSTRVAGGTLADLFRAKHQRVLSSSTEDFPIPGWDGNLVARCEIIGEADDFDTVGHAPNANAAFIARATVELLLRDADGKLQHLADRYDQVAELLELPAGSASGVVLELVGPHKPGETNPAALAAFALDVLRWMQGRRDEAADDLRPT